MRHHRSFAAAALLAITVASLQTARAGMPALAVFVPCGETASPISCFHPATTSDPALPSCVSLPLVDDRCERWVAVEDGTALGASGSDADGANTVAVSHDGRVVFSSGIAGTATDTDALTVAHDAATGARLWADLYDGGSADYALGSAISPDGATLYIAGFTGSGAAFDALLIALEADSGERRWTATYAHPGAERTSAMRVGISPDGTTLFAAGARATGGDRDLLALVVDASDGAVLAATPYDGPNGGPQQLQGFAVAPDGSRMYLTGFSDPAPGAGPFDYTCETIAVGVDGALEWVARFDDGVAYDGSPGGLDVCSAVAATPDGATVMVTGSSETPGGGFYWVAADMFTVAYDARTGERRWVGRFRGPSAGQNYGFAVAVSPDGARVVTAGIAMGAGSDYDWDIGVAAYDAQTGAPSWETRYAMPGNDLAYAGALVVDATRAYVSGFDCTGPSVPPFRLVACTGVTAAYAMADGARAWVARYTPRPADSFLPYASVLAPGGGDLYVAGGAFYVSEHTLAGNRTDLVTLAYRT